MNEPKAKSVQAFLSYTPEQTNGFQSTNTTTWKRLALAAQRLGLRVTRQGVPCIALTPGRAQPKRGPDFSDECQKMTALAEHQACPKTGSFLNKVNPLLLFSTILHKIYVYYIHKKGKQKFSIKKERRFKFSFITT